MNKEAITRLAKELRKVYVGLGKTESARRAVVASGKYPAGSGVDKFRRMLSGTEVRNAVGGRKGQVGAGQFGDVSVGFNPEHGFVANKAFKNNQQLSRRKYLSSSPSPGREQEANVSATNAAAEMKNAKTVSDAHALDKKINPTSSRPDIAEPHALLTRNRLDRIKRDQLMPVGNGKSTMRVQAGHPLTRAKLTGSRYRGLSRKGQQIGKYRRTDYMEEIGELAEDGLGMIPKSHPPRTIMQSKLLDTSTGSSLSVTQERILGDFRKRIRDQSNVALGDLGDHNLGTHPSGKLSLMDFGEVRKAVL